MGTHHYREKNYDKAVEVITKAVLLKDHQAFLYLKIIANEKGHPAALLNVGTHYLTLDMPFDAIDYLAKALKKGAHNPSFVRCACYQLSSTYYELGDFENGNEYAFRAYEAGDRDIVQVLNKHAERHPSVQGVLTKLGFTLLPKDEANPLETSTGLFGSLVEKFKYVLGYLSE